MGVTLYDRRLAYSIHNMQPTILCIPLAHFVATGATPLTRDSVIDLARRCCDGPAREIHIMVTVDHDGGDIEVATIELRSASDGSWRLQYVSHPAQCGGLTVLIAPTTSDFVSFLQSRELLRQPYAVSALSAQELQDEGLGPLAILNLRVGHLAPVLPTRADLAQFRAMADIAPIQ